MSDAPAPAPADDVAPPPRPRWGLRLLRGLLAAVIGLVTVVLIVAGWLGGSGHGLRALTDFVGRLSGGVVTVERADGYLLGDVRLGLLRVRTPTLLVEVHDLALDWNPAALTRYSLDIARLRAADVVVASTPSDEPTLMPDSLQLPAALRVARFDIDRVQVGKLQGDQPAAPDLTLTALGGALESDGQRHRVRDLAVATPFGQLGADAELDGTRPFAVKSTAQLTTRQADEVWTIDATAGGNLDTLKLNARLAGAGIDGTAALVASPFAPLPLQSAKAHLTGVDPRRFNAAAPVARLDIDADLTPSATVTRPAAADWVVSGPVRIVNHAAGSYDAGKLPLESLAAQLRWANGELALSGLALRLPGKGRADGSLRWLAPKPAAPTDAPAGFGQLDAQLTIADLDARQLDRRAVATRIAGRIDATAEANAQTLRANLRDPQLALDLVARHAGGQITLDKLVARARAARLDATGHLALDAPGAFEAKGRLDHFNPQAFVVTAPPADLNTRFRLSGRRLPQLAGRVDFDLAPSTLEGKPLAGQGQLAIDGRRLTDADVALTLAGNRLSAKGRYGRAGDALAVDIDASQLAALGHGLGGRVRLTGTLRGSPEQPAGEFELNAEPFVFGSQRIERANGSGRIGEGRDGLFRVSLALFGLRTGGDARNAGDLLVEQAKLDLDGTRAANTLRFDVSGRNGNGIALTLAGALADGPRWQGRLTALDTRGAAALSLAAPATLSLAAERIELGAAELRGAAGGRYRFDVTRWEARHLLARGSLTGAQVGVILDPTTRQVQSRGTSLQIGGEWNVEIGEQVNGFVRLFREKGDLQLQGDSPVQLGLDDLQITVNAIANRIAFGFSASGSRLGRASGAGTALAERTADGAVRLAPNAPLLGSARIDIPSIAWAGPLADQNLKTDGSLKGEFTLGGTPAQPEAAGRIRGEQLAFVMTDQGLHLTGGTLQADFNRDRLNLQEFSFVSPNRVKPREGRIDVARLTAQPGTLKASGQVQLASGAGHFDFRAERLPLLQRVDQWLVLSGEGEVITGWNAAHLKGRLVADAGFVELSRTPPPSLGDDVVILDPKKSTKPAATPFIATVDLAIGLGNALYVKALGLDTRLAGDLRLNSGPGRPLTASGTITTVGGVYEGYGQKLSIDRGIVTFNGEVSNPSLNVVALRKGLSVEAGVGITGTARRPVVRLVSEPNVPDPEKLGWIVLGRPPDQGSGGEMALLLPAAQALLGDSGGGLSANLAHTLGFDEISFGTSVDSRNRVQTSSVATGSVTGTASSASTSNTTSVPGQVITIGKRLSAKAMLSFEQSVAGASSIVKLTYQLTRNIAVIGRAGSENALDVMFSLSFR